MNPTTTVRGGRRVRTFAAAALVSGTLLAGMIGGVAAQAVDGGLIVTSGDMTDGTALNPMFACSGFNPDGYVSPQLSWTGAPAGTQSYVVIMHDEFGANQGYDAPNDWSHWAAYNISAGTSALVRDASATGAVGGGTQGANTWGAQGTPNESRYNGPCPPPNGPHNYYFTVYALSAPITPTPTGIGGVVTTSDILTAMQGVVLDQGDIQVTFEATESGTNRADVELATVAGAGVEGETVALPVLLVNGVVAAPTTVTLTVTGGTATSASDFTVASPLTVTIPAGTYDGTTATAIAITGLSTIDDAADEQDETVLFALGGATGDAVISEANHDGALATAFTFTITDNDEPTATTPETPAAGGAGTIPTTTSPGQLAESGVEGIGAAFITAVLLIFGGLGALVLRGIRRRVASHRVWSSTALIGRS